MYTDSLNGAFLGPCHINPCSKLEGHLIGKQEEGAKGYHLYLVSPVRGCICLLTLSGLT